MVDAVAFDAASGQNHACPEWVPVAFHNHLRMRTDPASCRSSRMVFAQRLFGSCWKAQHKASLWCWFALPNREARRPGSTTSECDTRPTRQKKNCVHDSWSLIAVVDLSIYAPRRIGMSLRLSQSHGIIVVE
jgi:hypothetical protein